MAHWRRPPTPRREENWRHGLYKALLAGSVIMLITMAVALALAVS